MATPGFLDQLLARDPRSLVRFPDLPLEAALAELRNLQENAAARTGSATPGDVSATPAAGVTLSASSSSSPASSNALSDPAAPVQPAPSGATENVDAGLCALATHVWRAKGKLVDADTGVPREETRKIYRHVEGALESFTQMGITLNDWIGQPYDPGLPVKVLTFQPAEGVVRDTVIEAVRPTVIWRDRLLQLGEVVVGIPINPEKTS